MKKITKKTIYSTITTLFLLPIIVSAQVSVQLKNPVKFKNVQEVIAAVIQWIVNIGVVAVTLAFIYTGFQFVAARGNPEAINKAKSSFMWTVIGTLVLLGAQVLATVIKNTLTQGGVVS